MKNGYLKVFSLVSILCLASCSSEDLYQDIDMPDKNVRITEEEGNTQSSSLLYDELMKSFHLSPLLRSVGSDNIQYPEYYGGAYINDNNKLVIYVTENIKTNSKASLSNIMNSQDVIIRKGKYSYNQLNGIMDKINDFKIKNPNLPISDNFLCYYLSDSGNEVVVELQNFDVSSIRAFKETVCNSETIKFIQSKGKPYDLANVNPGNMVTIGSTRGSVGYRAKLSGKEGVVTAGHVISLNNYLEFGGMTFAKCTKYQYSGSVDASFCEILTPPGYTPTNTLVVNGVSSTLSTTISEPGVGTTINKIGQKTGHSSGKILNSNASLTVNGITITNLTSASLTADSGDSGGLVYSIVGSIRYTLGIMKGKAGNVAYYCKANKVNTALGTTRY